MRRRRWTTVFALASAGALLAIPARAVGQPASGVDAQAGRPHGNVTFVPVSADVQIIRTAVTADGQTRTQQQTDHFYRDSQGRVRQESGPLVTITDPATKTTVRLNVQRHTFQRTTAKPAARPPESAPGTSPAAEKPTFSPLQSLGTAQVSDVLAKGTAYTITSPRPNAKPVTQEVTVWASQELQLPVQTRVVKSTGATYEQTYTAIKAGASPPASLFTVPAGYHQGSVEPLATDQTCPLFNDPDPLILFDFGAGFVQATTNPQIGCRFVADAWASILPLELFPQVPLGFAFDLFLAIDDGLPSPCGFLPCPVPGDIVFVAQNNSDTTIKDSAVILVRFFF